MAPRQARLTDLRLTHNRATGEVEIAKYYGSMRRIILPSQVELGGTIHIVTSIGTRAFAGTQVCEVIVPATIRTIGDWAFSDCHQLETITIEGVKRIGLGAFDSCAHLTTVNLPDTLQEISPYCFADCHMLQLLVIPPGVKRIPPRAFSGCRNLSRVHLSIGTRISVTHPIKRAGWYRPITAPQDQCPKGTSMHWLCDDTQMEAITHADAMV